MKILNKVLCSVISIICLNCLCDAQQSPCPTIFQYQYDQNQNLYGLLNINSPSVAEVKLVVEISVGVKVDRYHGAVDLAYSREQAADNAIKGRPLQYKVSFPPWGNIPPRITRVQVNGRVICTGPKISGASTITTITLQHSLSISIPGNGQNFQIPDSFEGDRFPNNNVQNSNDRYEPSFINPAIFENNRPLSNDKETAFASNVPIDFNPQRPSQPSSGTPATNPSQLFNRPIGNRNPPVISRPESTTPEWAIPENRPTRPPPSSPPPQGNNFNKNTCGTPSKTLNPLVVFGDKVAKREFPWLAALFTSQSGKLNYQCGGSLISSRHIVTAAHCCKIKQRRVRPENLKVVLGKLNINEAISETGWKRVDVEQIFIHDDYQNNRADFDVGILKLAENIQTTNDIMPICLWTESVGLNRVVGQTGVVAGWGRNENNEAFTEVPAQISMPIVSNTECVKSYSDFSNLISNTTFCAGGENERGPCNGDSGSGFIMKRNNRWTLRGIVALSLNSNGLCDLTHYVVFTDAAKLLPWIQEAMLR